jgi:hypothetical protein
MPTKIVAMTCMPGCIERGSQIRTGTDYSRYGQVTWKWWCKQHGFEFVVLDQPLGGQPFEKTPPSIQRWFAPAMLMRTYGEDAKIVMVDADTMIRWDAPDFFDLGGPHLAVGHANSIPWISSTIAAYQSLFTDVQVLPFEYFNSGVVVMGKQQLPFLKDFTEFAKVHWLDLRAVQMSGNYGSDQTPLNFIARRNRLPIHFLPPMFNLLNCGSFARALMGPEKQMGREEFLRILRSNPYIFDFINHGYVWHFSALYRYRSLLMAHTWSQVCERYPGCDLERIS